MRTVLAHLIPLVLLTFLPGCMVTEEMWHQATQERMESPAIAGSLNDSPNARPRAIIVNYNVIGGGWFQERPNPVIVPLKSDGNVVDPFAFTPRSRDLMRIHNEIPSTQRTAVSRYLFSSDDLAAGKRARRSPQFVPLNRQPGGVATHESSRTSWADGISITSFWPAGKNEDHRFFHDDIPADATIVVLPATQPRPKSDRDGQIALAVVATPLTLVADVFVTPVVMIAWNLPGGPFAPEAIDTSD